VLDDYAAAAAADRPPQPSFFYLLERKNAIEGDMRPAANISSFELTRLNHRVDGGPAAIQALRRVGDF